MNNKYYTPKEDEFYSGFEYECCKCLSKSKDKTILDNIFIKYKFEVCDFLNYGDYYLDRCISDSMVRVKYLDSEDIKSFGFYNEKDVYSTYNKRFVYKRDERTHYCLGLNDDNYSIFISIINSSTNKELAIIFTGKIKNKSELKKILTQLFIIKEQ